MTLPFKVVILVAGAGGTIAAVAGGLYFHSKKTIGSKLGDSVLGTDESFKDSWKNQISKLKKEAKDLKEFPKLEKIKENEDSEKSWRELRDWCSSSYSFTYTNIFSREDNARLKLTKKYCVQIIRERLSAIYSGENRKVLDVSGDNDSGEFTANYKKLKDHKEELTGYLAGIDVSRVDSEAATNWVKVKEWCSDLHNKPFKGEDSIFKLAEKLCVKGNQ